MTDKAKILIVDDTPANLVALQAILSDLEANIYEADSGNQALSLTLKHDFGLILLDVQMPEMTGYEVASILRSNPKTTSVPIIFLTAAYKDEQHKIKGYDSGAVDYIEKPINDEILLPKVRFFLQLHLYQQQLKDVLKGEQKANDALKIEIQKRNTAEANLIHALQLADIASKSKGEFLATMSHEIRTPMNGVLGMAELLADSDLTSSQHDQVQTIINSGSLLLTILNDILDFSKLEAGKVELEAIPFNLERTIHEVLQLLSVRSYKKNMELILDYPPDIPHDFIGDPARLRQILNNLISNSIKFTEKGHIRIHVELERQQNNNALITLYVEDTGIGISAENINKLFSSFTQADSSTTRKYGGTGLGLSICKQLIEVMDGKIWVESTLGQGSSFNFQISLPLSETPAPFIDKDLTGTKILLVDDNQVNRELFSQFLKHFGTDATILDSALDVIQTMKDASASNTSFDIVILDYNMPAKTGLQLGKEIRKIADFDNIKLMVLTSSATRGDAQFFTDAGFDAYLSKPVRSDILRDTIISTLHGKRNSSGIITQHSIAESKQHQEPVFSGHILLVEDTKVNQKVAVGMLKKLGLDVDIAEDGEMAVEFYQLKNYDLIFMDCRMPNMDGYDATKIIRDKEKNLPLHTPIIALTANALPDDISKCKEAGMDDIITKPFRRIQLAQALEQWLGHVPTSALDHSHKNELSHSSISSETSVNVKILDVLKENVGDILPEIIEAFKESTIEVIDTLETWQPANDPEELIRMPHSLKSSSANIGAMNLSEIAAECESHARDGNTQDALNLLDNIKAEYQRVLFDLQNMGY